MVRLFQQIIFWLIIYYENYIKEIFDPQRRLTSTKAYFPLNVILNLKLADKIQIFENLYKINKIVTNFETNQSTLELINVKEQAGELIEVVPIIPDKFVTNSKCITVDDTIQLVSDVKITVDATCNFEGRGDLYINEVVPNDLEENNNPDQVEKDVALVVTPAVLADATQPTPTSSEIYLKHSISSIGKIGETPNIDEYGFFYSATESHLNSTDIETLKTTATNIPILTTSYNKHTFTGDVTHQISGLSSGDTIYWRFYARTNINDNYAKADVLSEIKENATTLGCTGDSYEYIEIQNQSANDNTITYLKGSTLSSRTLKGYSVSIIIGSTTECICEESITGTENFIITQRGTKC